MTSHEDKGNVLKEFPPDYTESTRTHRLLYYLRIMHNYWCVCEVITAVRATTNISNVLRSGTYVPTF